MSGLEVVAITLGAAVARAACGIWFGDAKLAGEVGTSLIDLAARKLTSAREQRRFRRVWDEAAEHVADRIQPLVEREFRDLPPHELAAALDAVRDTFDAAPLTEEDLFTLDLDAGYLDRYLRSQDADRTTRAGLTEGAVRAYDLVLRECCAYAIEMARALPGAGVAGLAELLRRDRQILADIAEVLARLPERRGVQDFASDYRQLVANRLDRVEFFGATLSGSIRRWPLSVAYLSLTVNTSTSTPPDPVPPPDPVTQAIERVTATFGGPPPGSVERVLARADRIFIRGQAGTGKTTLLHWIAVRSGRRSFPDHLASWNRTVPFFIPLRRYATTALPAHERFLEEVGEHLDIPPGWVARQLRDGDAIVLVDGVDELPDGRRDEVRRWLSHLIDTYPRSRYVVTSRPAAAPRDWLAADGFLAAELEPMTPSQVQVFVNRWHEAVRTTCHTEPERDEVTAQEERLLHALDTHRHLRQLAGYPLLCALLCALHRDRHGQLPANRMELYEVALHMLLERRDRERGIAPVLALSRTEQTLLLCDLAYWLIRNGWSDASRAAIIGRLTTKLRAMPGVQATPDEIYQVLLERTGLLREPVEGRVDFIHRSFQEYLAAKQAVDEDDAGMLIRHAHLPDWHEVVVMAAGHATAGGRNGLLRGLLDRADAADTSRAQRDLLRLVALACLETSPELSPEIARAIRHAAAKLIPPHTEGAARALGRAGSLAIDLLMTARPTKEYEMVLMIAAIQESGDPAGLPVLARFGTDSRPAVVDALVRAWSRFDPAEYAQRVLRDSPLRAGELLVRDRRLLPAVHELRRLRYLTVSLDGLRPVDLDFVRRLPHLHHLAGPVVADLAPLAGHPLRSLGVRAAPPGLDLAAIADMPQLTTFTVQGDVANGDVLAALDLTTLQMDGKQFQQTGVTHWPTLRRLLLIGMGTRTLSALAGIRLPRLKLLTLDIAVASTLDALPDAPDLERLYILFRDELDLAALAHATVPTIELHYRGSEPLDLRPLAGRGNVLVNMYRRYAPVLGEEDLGEGSLVQSAWSSSGDLDGGDTP
ncbi:NACHT domain-containing protein [Actinomycetes bacterium KLBMP 9797]